MYHLHGTVKFAREGPLTDTRQMEMDGKGRESKARTLTELAEAQRGQAMASFAFFRHHQ